MEWRIQDFPDVGGDANPRVLSKNLLFSKIFTKNCMNMKEIGQTGDCPVPPWIRQCDGKKVASNKIYALN